MARARKVVQGIRLLLDRDSVTGHAYVTTGRATGCVYIGELFPQVIDYQYLHLCELSPGVEAWEPDRKWPWTTHHHSFDTEYEALCWLLQRARKRGDL